MNNKYLTSEVMGVETYVDRYIAKDGELYFCSCFKGAESVKGAQAGFLQNNDWKIDNYGYKRLKNNYKQLSVKLGSALTHGIVYATDFFNGNEISPINIVFGETEEETRVMAFSRLKAYSSVPILDIWKDAILNETASMIPMEQFGFGFVYEIELPTNEILKEYVMANIESLTQLTEK